MKLLGMLEDLVFSSKTCLRAKGTIELFLAGILKYRGDISGAAHSRVVNGLRDGFWNTVVLLQLMVIRRRYLGLPDDGVDGLEGCSFGRLPGSVSKTRGRTGGRSLLARCLAEH